MRLFCYEYMTAVGPTEPGAASLSAEGWAMLSAMVDDFGRLPDVQTVTMVHEGIARPLGQQCVVTPRAKEEEIFSRLAASADYTLVIAPELDGILERRCRSAVECGGRLLGPSPAAVALTADKLALAGRLRSRDVPTPVTMALCSAIAADTDWTWYPAVSKPRYGAGSQDVFLLRSPRDLTPTIKAGADYVIQNYIPGQAASIAFLIGRDCIQALLPATQELSTDGRFRYLGGRIPLPPDLSERTLQLGRSAVQAIPGLRGYVGVDLVLGSAADGSGDSVIEINPRLTTSYVGLRRLAQGNLAAAMLASVSGTEIPETRWLSRSVLFCADGRVEWTS